MCVSDYVHYERKKERKDSQQKERSIVKAEITFIVDTCYVKQTRVNT